MARKKRTTQQKEVQDYRHDTATRKNNPPAGIAAQEKIKETPKQEYAYNPHLPPNLRSDPNGDADKLPELLEKAQQQALTAEEAKTIADALRHYDKVGVLEHTSQRRFCENHRRCAPTLRRPMARMGRQTRGKILHRRSGGIAYPRARQCQSHLESRRTPKRPT